MKKKKILNEKKSITIHVKGLDSPNCNRSETVKSWSSSLFSGEASRCWIPDTLLRRASPVPLRLCSYCFGKLRINGWQGAAAFGGQGSNHQEPKQPRAAAAPFDLRELDERGSEDGEEGAQMKTEGKRQRRGRRGDLWRICTSQWKSHDCAQSNADTFLKKNPLFCLSFGLQPTLGFQPWTTPAFSSR